jgi:hypothetical protein
MDRRSYVEELRNGREHCEVVYRGRIRVERPQWKSRQFHKCMELSASWTPETKVSPGFSADKYENTSYGGWVQGEVSTEQVACSNYNDLRTRDLGTEARVEDTDISRISECNHLALEDRPHAYVQAVPLD